MRAHLGLIVGLACTLAATGTLPARSAEEPPFAVAIKNTTVRIGDDIVVRATFVNRSREALVMPELRLARDSLSATIASEDGGVAAQDVTRLYGGFVAADEGLVFRPRATGRRRLAPGEEMSADLRIPALVVGKVTVRVAFGTPGPQRWRAGPVDVEVAPAGAAREPVAIVETTRGTVTMRIDPLAHYGAAAQFWTLARSGFYDGLDVHRVVPQRLVQSGDPRGDGAGDAGWFLPARPAATPLRAGDVGLARGAHPDSASSQWFVALAEGIPGDYARIATVTAGLDVLRTLRAGDSPDTIRSIRVEVR